MFSVVLFVSVFLQAWQIDMNTGFNLNQSYYNSAWNGDENGSVVWTGLFDMKATKQMSKMFLFENRLNLAYGQTYSQDTTGIWSNPQVSTDKVEDESVLRMTMGWGVDPFASFMVKTGFYDEGNSMYLNPVEMIEGLGMAKTLFKTDKDELNARIGFASKHIWDRTGTIDDALEGGLEFVSNGKYNLLKNVEYNGQLRIFKAIFKTGTDTTTTWKSPDVDFQNTLSFSLNDYFKVNLYVEVMYDKDVIDAVQMKENLGLGISYRIK